MATLLYIAPGCNEQHLSAALAAIDAPAGLCVAAGAEESRAMASRHAPGVPVFICPLEEPCIYDERRFDPVLRQLVSANPDVQACLVGPLSIESLRFKEEALVPDYLPYYPALRYLHHHGVRHFLFISGEHRFDYELPFLLDDFAGLHRGQRAFVIGNGPSLNKINMSLLEDEITLGSNRCFLGFKRWGFAFKYWGIEDRMQAERYHDEYIENLPDETPKFVPIQYLEHLKMKNICPTPTDYGETGSFRDGLQFPQFSSSPRRLYLGYTVTYTLMQVAAIMGCNPIILIGVDHTYGLQRTTQAADSRAKAGSSSREDVAEKAKRRFDFWKSSDTGISTHFDASYTQGEQKVFIAPRPSRAESAYLCAHTWAQYHGVQILNATPGSMLDVFPRINYETLF